MAGDDGRTQRRQRNRDAVVEALLAMVAEGELAPGTDEIAARAGLSSRSLFRYFDDADDLCRAAIARQHERVGALLDAPVDTAGSCDERAVAVVEQRVRLFDAMGEVGRLARLRAPFQPLIADELTAARRVLRRRLAAAMAPELDALGTGAERALDAADVLCSFEAYRLLRDDLGRSRRVAVAVMASGVAALLVSANVASR
jgi:TetR/AcrR family transcriptional regulator, regulator of autoinduction and epiphytic fitness